MRAAILAALAVGAMTALISAPAEARNLPYCIKGQGYPSSTGDCSFWTYEQCQETASGRFNYCDVNPFYAGPPPEDVAPRRPRSRRYGY